MNKLIACAMLGFGLTSLVVGCGDDDTADFGNTAGSNSGGASSAGTNSGGSSQAGSSGSGGTAGGGLGGAGGDSGGSASGGTGAGGTSTDGGAPSGGGAAGGEGGSAEVAGGAGGEGGTPPEKEPQLADEYWLNKFCDAKGKQSLGCANSEPWATCYDLFYGFLSAGGDGSGECVDDDEEYTKLLNVIDAITAAAEACGLPSTADFSCNLAGEAVAKDKACADADAAATAAYKVCIPGS